MKKIEVVEMASNKTDWELYELKDGRILRLDKHSKEREVYDDIDSVFNELKAYYRNEVLDMILNTNEEVLVETIELHKEFLNNSEKKEMISLCNTIAQACAYNGDQGGFYRIDSIQDRYK